MPYGYWGRRAAGIALVCPADRSILLVLRSADVNEPNTWGLPGGRVEPGENIFDAAVREMQEELGSAPEGDTVHAEVFRDGSFSYTTFFVAVPTLVKVRWTPTIVLNWENDAAQWWNVNALPRPLHFGMEGLRTLLIGLVDSSTPTTRGRR